MGDLLVCGASGGDVRDEIAFDMVVGHGHTRTFSRYQKSAVLLPTRKLLAAAFLFDELLAADF